MLYPKRYRCSIKLITYITIATFLWSNYVWAGGLSAHDTLAPSTNLPILYKDAQLDMIALDVIDALACSDVDNITVFYKDEIEKEVRGRCGDVRCFGIRDVRRRQGKWAFYVVDMGNNVFTRYSSGPDVEDRLFNLLQSVEEPIQLDSCVYNLKGREYEKGVYRITDGTRPLIERCLDKLPADIFESKDISRGKVDELTETHPALEEAANSGRMFALEMTLLDYLIELELMTNEDLAGLFVSYLVNLKSPEDIKNRILQRLEDPIFRDTLLKGFALMGEAMESQPLTISPTKPVRLCIVVEDEGLPTIVFKDPFNNLLAHSGKGEKTNTPYMSIYAGFNSVKVAVEKCMQEGFREVIRHEVRDIIRGYHEDDFLHLVNDLYNKVLISEEYFRELREALYDRLEDSTEEEMIEGINAFREVFEERREEFLEKPFHEIVEMAVQIIRLLRELKEAAAIETEEHETSKSKGLMPYLKEQKPVWKFLAGLAQIFVTFKIISIAGPIIEGYIPQAGLVGKLLFATYTLLKFTIISLSGTMFLYLSRDIEIYHGKDEAVIKFSNSILFSFLLIGNLVFGNAIGFEFPVILGMSSYYIVKFIEDIKSKKTDANRSVFYKPALISLILSLITYFNSNAVSPLIMESKEAAFCFIPYYLNDFFAVPLFVMFTPVLLISIRRIIGAIDDPGALSRYALKNIPGKTDNAIRLVFGDIGRLFKISIFWAFILSFIGELLGILSVRDFWDVVMHFAGGLLFVPIIYSRRNYTNTPNSAVATQGMYTPEQHEKIKEKIRGDIAAERYQELSFRAERGISSEIVSEATLSSASATPRNDILVRIQEVWESLDNETRKALEDVTLFLLPPEDPEYLYYLRTEMIGGKLEYQVVHAGSWEGRGRFVYMTEQAFIELSVDIVVRILRREARLAGERYEVRKGVGGLNNVIGYDGEAQKILDEITCVNVSHGIVQSQSIVRLLGKLLLWLLNQTYHFSLLRGQSENSMPVNRTINVANVKTIFKNMACILPKNPPIMLAIINACAKVKAVLLKASNLLDVQNIFSTINIYNFINSSKRSQVNILDNSAIATLGMYTPEQHEKMNEKIRRGIAAKNYQELSFRAERGIPSEIVSEATLSSASATPRNDILVRIQEVWESLDSETRKALEDVTLFLLPPEDPEYPYYLRTEMIDGKLEYQVAHAGSWEGRGRFIYMTQQAFVRLPMDIVGRILQREARLAGERYKARLKREMSPGSDYDYEVVEILKEISNYSIFNCFKNSLGDTTCMLWNGFNISKSLSFVTITSALAATAVSSTILSAASLQALIFIFGLTTVILELIRWRNSFTTFGGIPNFGRERTSASSISRFLDVTSSKRLLIKASHIRRLAVLPINALTNIFVSITALILAMVFFTSFFADAIYFAVSNVVFLCIFLHLSNYLIHFGFPQILFKIFQNLNPILWFQGIYEVFDRININTYCISHFIYLLPLSLTCICKKFTFIDTRCQYRSDILGSNSAIATPGMYTPEQHQKINEKIRRDLENGVQGFNGSKVQELREDVWAGLDQETRQALEEVSIFLLPPENPEYPYYLRTDGAEYQVAHAGSWEGRGRFVYMTEQAFMRLPMDIVMRIMQREARLARERYKAREKGQEPNAGKYNKEVKNLLDRIEIAILARGKKELAGDKTQKDIEDLAWDWFYRQLERLKAGGGIEGYSGSIGKDIVIMEGIFKKLRTISDNRELLSYLAGCILFFTRDIFKDPQKLRKLRHTAIVNFECLINESILDKRYILETIKGFADEIRPEDVINAINIFTQFINNYLDDYSGDKKEVFEIYCKWTLSVFRADIKNAYLMWWYFASMSFFDLIKDSDDLDVLRKEYKGFIDMLEPSQIHTGTVLFFILRIFLWQEEDYPRIIYEITKLVGHEKDNIERFLMAVEDVHAYRHMRGLFIVLLRLMATDKDANFNDVLRAIELVKVIGHIVNYYQDIDILESSRTISNLCEGLEETFEMIQKEGDSQYGILLLRLIEEIYVNRSIEFKDYKLDLCVFNSGWLATVDLVPREVPGELDMDMLHCDFGGNFVEAGKGSLFRIKFYLKDSYGEPCLFITMNQPARAYWRLPSSVRARADKLDELALQRIIEIAERVGIKTIVSITPELAASAFNEYTTRDPLGVARQFYGEGLFRKKLGFSPMSGKEIFAIHKEGQIPYWVRRTKSGSQDDSIISARYGIIPENLRDNTGGSPSGWLWKEGIPGLEAYDDKDVAGNINLEIKNALKIRNYILRNGRGLDIGEDFPIELMVCDGGNGGDEYLNEIIVRNIRQLFQSMGEDARYELLYNLRGAGSINKIVIAILEKSRHWCENCRGDRFIGINRELLEKMRGIQDAVREERKGQNRPDVIEGLEARLNALEVYLQTYLYHELRHEAFREERDLLMEMAYEGEMGRRINVSEMDARDLMVIINSLTAEKREWFENELERRQNGWDAEYFTRGSGDRYEEFMDYLQEFNIQDINSRFLHAAAIAGFAFGIDKHYNELTIKDFKEMSKGRIVKGIYARYEEEYTEMYRRDRENTELNYRGKIAYLLYTLGFNNYIRVDEWRKSIDIQRQYDRGLAKRYILRLIEFVSEYERYIAHMPGRGEVSMFKRRERPLPYQEAAQILTVSLLSSGDYNQAILRTGLAFKTSGIVNTVTGNKFEFWKLVVETCAERVGKGDRRFEGITADIMKKASIEREMLPRLRIIYLFNLYLSILPGSKFQQPYKDTLQLLCRKYKQYRKGEEVVFNDEDIEGFDKLYKKILNILSELFDVEDEDILVTLWDTFDLVKNIFPGSLPDAGFTPGEMDDIIGLKRIFDKDLEDINPRDIKTEETKRRVQIVLGIYKDKVLRLRTNLCDILRRYGTDKALNGNSVWDLMYKTRGWASAEWVAREYKDIFLGGLAGMALELDSGLSVFYRALLDSKDMTIDKVSGLWDFISDKGAEYFGGNPNRIAGDFVSGDWIDVRTGERIGKEEESCTAIFSIYNLHTITGPRRMYNTFKEVNRALKYGGHFAITLPFGRMFSEECLEALREKMGFVLVGVPGVTWNELSEESRERIRRGFGDKGVEQIERELRKNRFYIIILKKVGMVKEGAEELQDKSVLIPGIVTEREKREPVEPSEAVSGEIEEPKTPGFIRAEGYECVSHRVRGLEPGAAAKSLLDGLGESDRLKEKAENVGALSADQELIRLLLEEEVTPPEKLKDYVKGDLSDRVGRALSYEDSDYTKEIEGELSLLYAELERLKRIILANHERFTVMLDWIRQRVGIEDRLNEEDRGGFERVVLFVKTDLCEGAFKEVQDIYEKLLEIEQSIAKRRQFIMGNWDKFRRIQSLIRKYRIVLRHDDRNINWVLNVKESDLTPELMQIAEQLSVRMAHYFNKKFNSLKGLEDMLSVLFKYINCEFFFNSLDMEVLSRAKEEWEKDRITDSDVIRSLAEYIEAIELWDVLKETIDWVKGLAGFLKGRQESEYMDILDEELLYKPWTKGRCVKIDHRMLGEGIKGILMSENRNMAVGDELIITMSDCYDFTERFLNALDGLGFEVRNLFNVWLEISRDGVETNVRDFMRRGKRMIVVHKKGEPASISADSMALVHGRRETQDFSRWIDIRETVLQKLEPADFGISSCEILSREQMRRMYADWAREYLGRGKWTGNFFDRAEVESAVAEYRSRVEEERRRAAEEERIRSEREANLIRRSSAPLVGITYDSIFTESLVKDLAHILMKLISDFSSPPEFDILLNNPLIANHPQLNKISGDVLVGKIEELIRFRRYILQVERAYRGFGKIMSLLFPRDGRVFHNIDFLINVEVDGLRGIVDIMRFEEISKVLWWYYYNIGPDLSPFGEGVDEWHERILGNYLLLRSIRPEEIYDGYSAEDKILSMQFLQDPTGKLEQFAGKLKGLDIVVGHRGFRKISSRLEGYRSPLGNISFEGLFGKAADIVMLLSQIYRDKNLGEEYLKDLEYYMFTLLALVSAVPEKITQIVDIANKILENFKELFEERMTIQDYEGFKRELQTRLRGLVDRDKLSEEIRRRESLSRMRGETITGSDWYYYFMHGKGQEVNTEITEHDVISSRFADRECKVMCYFDALNLLKSVRLFKISEEEKRILDGLIEVVLLNPGGGRCEEVINYIKARNVVNRYLYFSFMCLCRTWGQSVTTIDNIEIVTEEIMKVEPKLMAYTELRENGNIIVLLMELYRLMQMLEDPLLREANLEIRISAIDLVEIIQGKLNDGRLLAKLNKMTDKLLRDGRLQYYLAEIGNPYHIDLIPSVLIGLGSLRECDQNSVQTLLDRTLDEMVGRVIISVVEELKILFMYFPNEKDVALQNVARAIASEAENENMRLFLRLFKEQIPDEFGRLEELIKKTKGGMPIRQWMKSFRRALHEISTSKNVPEAEKKKIKKDSAFRHTLLININLMSIEAPSAWGDSIKFIMESMENPYEIYYLFKALTTSPWREEGVVVHPEIINNGIKRMMDFAKTGWKDEVKDILTRAYNQYFTMREFIAWGLDSNQDLMKYIAELFTKGSYTEAACAYKYMGFYITFQGSLKIGNEGKARSIHKLFSFLIEGLLANGDNVDHVRFRRALELFALAVGKRNIELHGEWQFIISRFKGGKISRETLLAIARNAEWIMKEVRGVFARAIEKKRGGEDTEGPKDIGSAFFGEMSQEEIHPQIRAILEDPSERFFYFIKGRSYEGKTGRLDVSNEYKKAVSDASTHITRDYPVLQDYSIVILQGVNFSGHYGRSRRRIYIPIEIIEIAIKNPDMPLLEEFIEHEYLHTLGLSESDILSICARKRPGVYERARELYGRYISNKNELVETEGEPGGNVSNMGYLGAAFEPSDNQEIPYWDRLVNSLRLNLFLTIGKDSKGICKTWAEEAWKGLMEDKELAGNLDITDIRIMYSDIGHFWIEMDIRGAIYVFDRTAGQFDRDFPLGWYGKKQNVPQGLRHIYYKEGIIIIKSRMFSEYICLFIKILKESIKLTPPKGLIIIEEADAEGLRLLLNMIKKNGIDLSNFKIGILSSGKQVKENSPSPFPLPATGGERIEVRGIGLNILYGENIDSIIAQAGEDNVVYLGGFNNDQAEEMKRKGIKLLQSGHAGLPLEFTLAIKLLEIGNYYINSDLSEEVKSIYREYLDCLVMQGLINEKEKESILVDVDILGYIVLPRIQKVLDIWNELRESESYLKKQA